MKNNIWNNVLESVKGVVLYFLLLKNKGNLLYVISLYF